MLIDDKGRVFNKISIIDILFIALIILAGTLAWFKFSGYTVKDNVSIKTDKIKIIFYQEDINNFAANNVKIGDPATEALQNIKFGQVIDIELGESIFWSSDIEGNQVSSPKEGYSSIYITMEGKGIIGPNGILIGNFPYHIGDTITLRVGNSIFFGKIYGAEKI